MSLPPTRRAAALLAAQGDGVTAANSPTFSGLDVYEWTVESLTYSDADPVDTWAAIGNTAVLTATGADRPTFKTDGTLGDGSCVRFSSHILSGAGLSIDASAGMTVFFVMKVTTAGSFRGPMAMRTSGAAKTQNSFEFYGATFADEYFAVVNRTGAGGTFGYWKCRDTRQAAGTPFIVSARMADSLDLDDDPYLVENTVPNVTEAAHANLCPAPASVIAEVAFGEGYSTNKFVGDLYAVVAYVGGVMTPTQVTSVYSSLATRFA